MVCGIKWRAKWIFKFSLPIIYVLISIDGAHSMNLIERTWLECELIIVVYISQTKKKEAKCCFCGRCPHSSMTGSKKLKLSNRIEIYEFCARYQWPLHCYQFRFDVTCICNVNITNANRNQIDLVWFFFSLILRNTFRNKLWFFFFQFWESVSQLDEIHIVFLTDCQLCRSIDMKSYVKDRYKSVVQIKSKIS